MTLITRNSFIPRVIAGPLGLSNLYRRHPWVPAWWSVVLPGFGHLFLGQYLKGFLFMSWEILVNTQAHLNTAIFYTLLGRWEEAQKVLNYKWAVLYPLFYVFALVDAYRLAVEAQQYLKLELRQRRRRFDRVHVSIAGITGLDQRNPTLAAFWSALLIGAGQVYCGRHGKALVLMGWYFAIVIKSNLSLAVFHTLLGQFDIARQVVDYQWLLFWPSLFLFGICDAYDDAMEANNLTMEAFRYNMRKYLKNEDVTRGARLPS